MTNRTKCELMMLIFQHHDFWDPSLVLIDIDPSTAQRESRRDGALGEFGDFFSTKHFIMGIPKQQTRRDVAIQT